jgi:hypothetical protein
MRSLLRARWASCALVLPICLPVAVADHKKSIADCASVDQQNKGEDTVAFTIANACTVPLDCKLEWQVVCAPYSKSRRAVHPGTHKVTLVAGASQSTEASAAICGDDAWSIDAVEWSCEPNKD